MSIDANRIFTKCHNWKCDPKNGKLIPMVAIKTKNIVVVVTANIVFVINKELVL